MPINQLQQIADLLDAHLDATKVWIDGRVIQIRRRIARVKDLIIEIYPNDHYPPHFHVISNQRGINARFSIKTLTLLDEIQGHISSQDLKKIQNYFEHYPDSLEFLRAEYQRFAVQASKRDLN